MERVSIEEFLKTEGLIGAEFYMHESGGKSWGTIKDIALDGDRLLALGAAGLDHVGVDGALGQPFGIGQLFGFSLEHLDKLAANDLALLLWVAHTLVVTHELLLGLHMHHFGMQTACKLPAR